MNMLFNEAGRIVIKDDRFNDPPAWYIVAQSASWLGRYARARSTRSSTTKWFHIGGTSRHDGNRVVARCASSASDSIDARSGATWPVPKQRKTDRSGPNFVSRHLPNVSAGRLGT